MSTMKPSLKRSSSKTELSTPAASKLQRTRTPSSSSAMVSRANDRLTSISFEQERRRLQSQLSNSEVTLAECEQRVRLAESKVSERDARIARLEKDRAALAEREAERREDRAEAANEAWANEKAQLISQANNLQAALENLQDSHDNLETSHRQLAHSSSLLEAKVDSLTQTKNDLQSALDQSNNTLHTTRTSLSELQTKYAELEARPQPTASTDTEFIKAELTRQITHLKSLEAANARLTRENSVLKQRDLDLNILKEEKQSLVVKLKATEGLRRELAETESEVRELMKEKEEWTAYLDGGESPRDVSKCLAKERVRNAGLEERLGEMQRGYKRRDEVIAELEERVDELEELVRKLKEDKAKLNVSVRGLANQVGLLEKERDFLKTQLHTYSIEENQLMSPETYDAHKSERISHLEELLSVHQSELSEARKEQDRLRGMLEVAGGNTTRLEDNEDDTASSAKVKQSAKELLRVNAALLEEIQELQDSSSLLHKDVESLDIQVERLQEQLGTGAFNPATTRVLSFKDNPASLDLAIRTETLDGLRKENAALLEQVDKLKQSRVMEESEDKEETVPRATYDNAVLATQQANEELAQLQKAKMRLAEAFRTKAQEMRESVSALLGYRLDLREGGRIRLTSVFAHSSAHHLLFDPAPTAEGEAKSKELVLVGDGEGMSDAEKRSFQFWIADRKSIPCFLASLLLEHYENATRGGKFASFVKG